MSKSMQSCSVVAEGVESALLSFSWKNVNVDVDADDGEG
jgi:hypothetical protein